MGFFGYNKKDFEKSNQVLNNQVSEIARLTEDSDVREKLQCVRREMSKCSYSKENKRSLKKIDRNVLDTVSVLVNDIRQGNNVAFFAHADLLLSTVRFSRTFGKYALSEVDRRNEQILAESRISLDGEYKELEKIESEKAKIISESKGLPVGAKRDSLKRQYDAFAMQEDARKARIVEKTKIYNQNVGILNDQLQVQAYDQVPRIMTGKEFRLFSSAVIKKKLQFDKDNAEIDEARAILHEHLKPVTGKEIESDFDTKVLEAQHEDAISVINTSNVEEMDEFDRLVNEDNN